jgi:phosphopantothenoylcysteine synthetase/decarboxylase
VTADSQPVLYVVACGGPPAAELDAFIGVAQQHGWDVCVIATPDGIKFLDAGLLAGLTGHPVRSQYKQPDDPDVLPPADAFVVAPATFSTINRLALGISDTLALGLLNEGLGAGLPIIAVPWPNAALARHPAFQRSVGLLREWGVQVIFDPARIPGATSDPAVFPWNELRAALAGLQW